VRKETRTRTGRRNKRRPQRTATGWGTPGGVPKARAGGWRQLWVTYTSGGGSATTSTRGAAAKHHASGGTHRMTVSRVVSGWPLTSRRPLTRVSGGAPPRVPAGVQRPAPPECQSGPIGSAPAPVASGWGLLLKSTCEPTPNRSKRSRRAAWLQPSVDAWRVSARSNGAPADWTTHLQKEVWLPVSIGSAVS